MHVVPVNSIRIATNSCQPWTQAEAKSPQFDGNTTPTLPIGHSDKKQDDNQNSSVTVSSWCCNAVEASCCWLHVHCPQTNSTATALLKPSLSRLSDYWKSKAKDDVSMTDSDKIPIRLGCLLLFQNCWRARKSLCLIKPGAKAHHWKHLGESWSWSDLSAGHDHFLQILTDSTWQQFHQYLVKPQPSPFFASSESFLVGWQSAPAWQRDSAPARWLERTRELFDLHDVFLMISKF